MDEKTIRREMHVVSNEDGVDIKPYIAVQSRCKCRECIVRGKRENGCTLLYSGDLSAVGHRSLEYQAHGRHWSTA
jgi:hypothetical protein